jgi:hypothetical protein
MIPFGELHFITVGGSHPSSTAFNALGLLNRPRKHESSIKYAEWRGSKVSRVCNTLKRKRHRNQYAYINGRIARGRNKKVVND